MFQALPSVLAADWAGQALEGFREPVTGVERSRWEGSSVGGPRPKLGVSPQPQAERPGQWGRRGGQSRQAGRQCGCGCTHHPHRLTRVGWCAGCSVPLNSCPLEPQKVISWGSGVFADMFVFG